MRAAVNAAARFAAIVFIAAAGTALTGCGQKENKSAGVREETVQQSGEWFYDSFDERQKAAYDAFRSAADDPFAEEPVPIMDEAGESVKIPVTELDEVYQGFLYDHPEVFWLSRTYSYRSCADGGPEEFADAVLAVPLAGSEEELDEQKRKFESDAARLLHGLEDIESDRERASAIYNKLASLTEYEGESVYDGSKESYHTAYSVISENRGVCDGIALAYKYLLAECGIRSIVIPGESSGAAHVWNTVFWDGLWHEADLTWDIASGGNDSMQYFDLSTVEMSKDHKRETEGIAALIPDAAADGKH